MKLTLDHLSTRCPNYREISSLSLDCHGFTSVSDLEKCTQLQLLSLRFNSLQDISPVVRCRNIWILDLQQNKISNLEPLASLPALGSLILTSNPLILESFQAIKDVNILNLEVSGGNLKEIAGVLHSKR